MIVLTFHDIFLKIRIVKVKIPMLVAVTSIFGHSILNGEEAKSKSWWDVTSGKCSSAVQTATTKSVQTWEATRVDRERAAQAAVAAASQAWTATKDKSIQAWEATRVDREQAAKVAAVAADKAWAVTKDKSAQVWEVTRDEREKVAQAAAVAAEQTKKYYDEHETEINTAAVVVAAVAGAIIYDKCSGGGQSSATPQGGPYSHLSDSGSVSEGKDFTAAQKASILQANMKRNGGALVSDKSGEVLSAPGRYVKGYVPDPKEAQVDHIIPKSIGGTNSPGNAQILSREENLLKGATPP